ncbi:MAG: hypothetical protein FWB96_12325 [Defluviitaleaceae bacterium]|nr:hypothetical protein [Defluviitaleaceae bacterium]MCL2264257.1 hypothetical protein [Defluviitaleaceae bacterium]
MNDYANIDLTDIPEITGKTTSRKNPFYERTMKHGFSITEHYSPDDIAKITKGRIVRKIDITVLDEEEQAALERYEIKKIKFFQKRYKVFFL